MKTLLIQEARKLNINLTEEMIEKFFKFKDLLIEWNKVMNLTSITDEKEIIVKHFIDSLTIEKYIPKNSKVIDIGSGAGFPGIPLKIVREDISITLLDSLNKRVNFLNNVIKECKIKNAEAIHGRAEDLGQAIAYREKYDIVTARAVANLSTLSELCIPFIKVGGAFVCMKAEADEEIEEADKAIKVLGAKLKSKDKIKLAPIEANRTIIVYEKEKGTPKQYPRKAGTPAKSPIK